MRNRLPNRGGPARSALAACALAACALGLPGCSGEPLARPPQGAVILDLLDALPGAELLTEVGRLDIGSAAAHRHLVSGWSQDEREGDDTFVWGVGSASVLEIYLAEARDWTLVLDGEPMHWGGAPEQSVRVLVGGRVLDTLRLSAGRRRYEVAVPAAATEPGPIRIELRYGFSAAPAEVTAGALDQRPLAVRWYAIELQGLGPAISAPRRSLETLEIPAGVTVRYVIPGGATDLWIERVSGRTAGASLRVDLATDAKGPWRESVRIEAGGPARIQLPPVGAEELVELALSAEGVGKAPLELRAPAVYGAAAAASEPPARVERGGRPPVVLYVIDTLRADHLGVYGYPKPISPALDRFARDAVTFLEAEAQSSWTRTTVVSMLTGLNPLSHGVQQRDDALAPGHTTLAETLREAGYETRAVVTNGNVSEQFGLDQGFERYVYLRESLKRRSVHQLAHRLNERVDRWLPRLQEEGRPFFLYLHATDPHAPYTPRPAFRERFAADADPELGTLPVIDALTRGGPVPEGALADVIELYDAEIAYVDEQFGVLCDLLREAGLYDQALIVVVADHGEEFLEHGGWQHGKTLYGEQLRVPLLIKFPNNRFAGERVEGVARQVDIAPTVLDLLALEAATELDGESLLGLLEDGEAQARVSHSHLDLDARVLTGAATDRYRAIADDSAAPAGARQQLFDLSVDPRERRNLAPDRAVTWRALRWWMVREAERERAFAPARVRVTIDDELRSQLEALGYAQQ